MQSTPCTKLLNLQISKMLVIGECPVGVPTFLPQLLRGKTSNSAKFPRIHFKLVLDWLWFDQLKLPHVADVDLSSLSRGEEPA